MLHAYCGHEGVRRTSVSETNEEHCDDDAIGERPVDAATLFVQCPCYARNRRTEDDKGPGCDLLKSATPCE